MLMLFGSANYFLATSISWAIAIFFAFAYHEFAHAIVADRLGDDTPRAYGRITLNPFPHVSLVGYITAVLIFFGYASTPINPYKLRGNRRVSHALVAVAGPIANFIMALLAGLPILLGFVEPMAPIANGAPASALPSLYSLLAIIVWANTMLGMFNLLPIPPLDGFTILLGVLPAEWSYRLEGLRQYGFMIFIAVLFIVPRFLPFDLFGELVFNPAFALFDLLTNNGPLFF